MRPRNDEERYGEERKVCGDIPSRGEDQVVVVRGALDCIMSASGEKSRTCDWALIVHLLPRAGELTILDRYCPVLVEWTAPQAQEQYDNDRI